MHLQNTLGNDGFWVVGLQFGCYKYIIYNMLNLSKKELQKKQGMIDEEMEFMLFLKKETNGKIFIRDELSDIALDKEREIRKKIRIKNNVSIKDLKRKE